MADTRNNVSIPQGAWLDLSTASGVAVGTACTVYNKGNAPVNIAISTAAPSDMTGGFGIPLKTAIEWIFTANIPAGAHKIWGFVPVTTNQMAGIVLVQD